MQQESEPVDFQCVSCHNKNKSVPDQFGRGLPAEQKVPSWQVLCSVELDKHHENNPRPNFAGTKRFAGRVLPLA